LRLTCTLFIDECCFFSRSYLKLSLIMIVETFDDIFIISKYEDNWNKFLLPQCLMICQNMCRFFMFNLLAEIHLAVSVDMFKCFAIYLSHVLQSDEISSFTLLTCSFATYIFGHPHSSSSSFAHFSQTYRALYS